MIARRSVAVLAGLLSVLMSLALVSACVCAAQCEGDSCRERGREREKEKVEALKEEIAKDPDNVEQRIELGNLYVQIGGRRCGQPEELYGEALEEARKAVELSPDSVEANLLLCWCLFNFKDKSEEAMGPLRKILKEEPENTEAHYLLGKAYLESGDPDAAIGHLERIEELSSLNVFKIQRRYRSDLRRSQKMSELQKSCASGSAAWRDYRRLAQYYNESGRLDEAKKLLRKAASHADLRSKAYQELGHVLRDHGKYEQALKVYRKALASISKDETGTRPEKKQEEASLRVAMGDVYAELEKPEKALSEYDSAEELSGYLGEYISGKRGEIYARIGQPENAAREYEKGGEAVKSAQAYRAVKEYDKALEILWKKIGKESEQPKKRCGKTGEAVDKRGKPVKGLRYRVDPELYRELGNTYREMGQGGKAEMAYWEALKLDPSSEAASTAIE